MESKSALFWDYSLGIIWGIHTNTRQRIRNEINNRVPFDTRFLGFLYTIAPHTLMNSIIQHSSTFKYLNQTLLERRHLNNIFLKYLYTGETEKETEKERERSPCSLIF